MGIINKLVVVGVLAFVGGCGESDPPVLPRTPVVAPSGHAFARHAQAGRYDLPESSRPGGVAASEKIAFTRPFQQDGGTAERIVWKTPLPFAATFLQTRLGGAKTFGHYLPDDFGVIGPEGELVHDPELGAPHTFSFDRDWLRLALPPSMEVPSSPDFSLRFSSAVARENAMNLVTSEVAPEAFVCRSVTGSSDSGFGLFLPAPATATWSVTVPENGVITFVGTLLSPELPSLRKSDGAAIIVEVDEGKGDGPQEVYRVEVEVGNHEDARVDVSQWAGALVDVRFRTDSVSGALFDYVFIEEPILFSPSDRPARVVLIMVDALRADHLTHYRYPRDASPNIDALFADAAVFLQARTVAPWAFPAMQAALTGNEPEYFDETPTLQERMAEGGVLTKAFVGSSFLSSSFGMERGWSSHSYHHMESAAGVVDRAMEWLDGRPDQDVMVLVHLMDVHLPWEEAPAYRDLWAADMPSLMNKQRPVRMDMIDVDPVARGFRDVMQWAVDRYDQNLRMVDDEVARLVGSLDPQDTVILFADNGEEIWDHDGFEHGHTFYDEVMKVPLLIRDPMLAATRVSERVSLLDLAPTVLDLAGLPNEVEVGRSLVDAALGDPEARAQLAGRSLVFGRPLYEPAGWGVITADGWKWFIRDGVQHLYDLNEDPDERRDRGSARGQDLSPYPPELAKASGLEVVEAWRLTIESEVTDARMGLIIQSQGGIRAAWIGYDPLREFDDVHLQVDGNTFKFLQPPGVDAPSIVYVLPEQGVTQQSFQISLAHDTIRDRKRWRADAGGTLPGRQLVRLGDRHHRAAVEIVMTMVPRDAVRSSTELELDTDVSDKIHDDALTDRETE